MSITQSNAQPKNKTVLVITDSFPYPPRNGMEVTCHQNIIDFLNKGIEVKFIIMFTSDESKNIEKQRFQNSNFNSEIEFIKIIERPIIIKIFQEIFLITPTFLNYVVDKNLSKFKNFLNNVDYIFVPPVKGVRLYMKYLYKYINNLHIKTILHTNDCISSYYLGTFTRMYKGYEQKSILGISYFFRYPFIKILEKR